MYDKDAHLLSNTPFRYAIDFRQGVGIGTQGDTFNLFSNKGVVVSPFVKAVKKAKNEVYTEGSFRNFNNIRRDAKTGFYSLFFNQGLSPTVILTRHDGEIIVNAGRYDGISRFFGKYALVTAHNLVGLIDSFGQEVIAPQDLHTSTAAFMDSLVLNNDKLNSENDNSDTYDENRFDVLPFSYSTEQKMQLDNKNIETSANLPHLWNLILDKNISTTVMTASDIRIYRAANQVNDYFDRPKLGSKDILQTNADMLSVNDKTLSFILTMPNHDDRTEFYFHNFHRSKDRWEALKINDLLIIQGEKRGQFNDLITKKVKALENAQIDCSNTSAFVTTVENRFLLTKEGIDFHFDYTGGMEQLVKISFTWAELTPFLKMKIN
jgi:hypothetical protein